MPKESSEKLAPSSGKRSRTSGKHSRNGCGTCKIRRVKCDETKPICLRCRNFKITCDGYRQTPRDRDMEYQSKRPSLAPKPILASTPPSLAPSPPSITSSPSCLNMSDAGEYQYFSFFKDHLLFEITQSAQADVFRTLVLQAAVIPSIRHAMIALAALGKTHSLLERDNSNFLSSPESLEIKIHRDYSLSRYAKALTSMKECIAAGNQDIRITLLTCLLIICIECLHGNFAMANVQIANGMALLREWRKGYANAKDHPIGLSSPSPSVVEDSLVQMIGGLEIQSISSEKEEVGRQGPSINGMVEGQRIVDILPTQFQSLEESRIYLELLIRRSNRWLRSARALQKSTTSTASSPVPNFHFTGAQDPSYFNTTPVVPSQSIHGDNLVQTFTPSQYTTAINSQQALYIQDLQAWKTALDTLTTHHPTISTNPSFKDQLLLFQCFLLTLRTIHSTNEIVFDKYAEEITTILDLAENIAAANNHPSNPGTRTTSFTIYQYLTTTSGPPYSVGLNCKVGSIRRRGGELLDLVPRDKISDGGVVLDMILRWVMEMDMDLGDEVTSILEEPRPWFERGRVRDMSVSTDGSRSSRGEMGVYDFEYEYEYEGMIDPELLGVGRGGEGSA